MDCHYKSFPECNFGHAANKHGIKVMDMNQVRLDFMPIVKDKTQNAFAEDPSSVKFIDLSTRSFIYGEVSMAVTSFCLIFVYGNNADVMVPMNQAMSKVRKMCCDATGVGSIRRANQKYSHNILF